jgi:hypothetical protein
MYCYNNLWNTNCALEQAGEMDFDFIMQPLRKNELAVAPETMTATSRMLLSPPQAYSAIAPAVAPWLELDSSSIDYYVSNESDDNVAVHLINMERQTKKIKVKLFNKNRNMSFRPCEIKTIVLARQTNGDFHVL